jgi:Icc-related predicted phosphoesterase
MKLLCISDTVEPVLYGPGLNDYASEVDAVISCGDLPFEYLEYIVTFLGRPLYYVRGNHDPESHRKVPGGCIPLDGEIVDADDVVLAGLSGCRLYSGGPNQYTEREMSLRAWRLSMRLRMRALLRRPKPLVLVTHSPPFGIGDGEDPAHIGFRSFVRLIDRHQPPLWLYGHVHLYGAEPVRVRERGTTRLVNVYGHQIFDIGGSTDA